MTWKPTASIDLPGNPVGLWSWPDAQHGFAASDTTFCITGNGGSTWRAEPLPPALDGLTQLDFVSPTNGWAVAQGRLLETTNGGVNWKQELGQISTAEPALSPPIR